MVCFSQLFRFQTCLIMITSELFWLWISCSSVWFLEVFKSGHCVHRCWILELIVCDGALLMRFKVHLCDPFSILNYRIKIFLIMTGRLNEPRMQLLLHDLVMIDLLLNNIIEIMYIILICRLCIAICAICLGFSRFNLGSFCLSHHCFKIIISIIFLISLLQK